MRSRMFTALSTLLNDPATSQLVLRAALAEIERLRFLISGLQRNRLGRRSEKLDDEKLQRGLEDLEQSVAEQQAGRDAAAAAAEPSVPEPKAAPASPRSKPAKRNRGALPAHLPRIEVIVDVEDKACPCCGATTHVIGEDRAERDCRKFWEVRPRGVFSRRFFDREWTRGLDCEDGEDRC
jgi:transposase